MFSIVSNMLNQTFNPKSLFSIISNDDIGKYQLGNDKMSIMTSITSISYEVSQHDFSFVHIGKRIINKKEVYSTDNVNEYFAIKKLNHTLKRIYQIKHSNRNEILKQFIDIVNDGSVLLNIVRFSITETRLKSNLLCITAYYGYLGILMICHVT